MNNDALLLVDPYPRRADAIFSENEKSRLQRLGEVVWYSGESPAPADEVDRLLPHLSCVIGQTAMPTQRLERSPRLKMIANVEGNFLPNIDYAQCHRRDIPVVSIGPVFAQPVAEMALGMALAACRDIVEADAAIRASREQYGPASAARSFTLRGQPIGLMGYGNIGRALVPMIRPMSGDISVHDPWLHEQILRDANLRPANLDELFRTCRVVFIVAGVTTENQGLIDRKYLTAMQADSVVVLVSRAAIVNFDDLLDAAASGHIRVAIDVFPEEPLPADHRARSTPNTVLSAHRAGSTMDVLHAIGRMVVDDVELVMRGIPPQQTQRAVLGMVERLRSKIGTFT